MESKQKLSPIVASSRLRVSSPTPASLRASTLRRVTRFSEAVSALFGRVELLALGAEEDRREASLALSRGDFLSARMHAKSLLARVPASKIGLALLADATEGAGFAEEAAQALEPLAEAMPWRADPWLRLARARRDARARESSVREALQRAAQATEGEGERREALLELCDLDLRSNDPARASRWLDRLSPLVDDPDVLLRRAEHALATGDVARAREAASRFESPVPSDGRRALILGRVLAHEGDARAFDWLLRAFILEAEGAEAPLSAYVADCQDAVLVSRARAVVQAAGALDEARWAWAFALSEGRGEDARIALRRAARERDEAAIRALLAWALHTRDRGALADAREALASTGQEEPAFARSLSEAFALHDRGDDAAALDALDAIPEGPGAAWRDDLRAAWMRGWLPGGEASWPLVLAELQRGAKALSRLDALSAVEAIAIERARPLRVAVLGEFNAGKSSFLNALLGEDVTPTGILPTTASLHWLSWAADRFARILVRGAPDRVVALPDLKRALHELRKEEATVERVLLHAPIELLRRIELLDTPGLNSGDEAHTEVASRAFEEAHVAIWILDATQPLKESERAALAELGRLNVPVWVLLNKRDRLSDPKASLALAHVREGLAASSLSSYLEILPISAKAALALRLGDESARATSGWERVEAGLEAIVGESTLLREKALRRRTKAVLAPLEAEARERREAEVCARAERERDESRLLAAASRWEQGERQAEIAASLREASQLLAEDLKPLASLADPRDAKLAISEGARRYAMDRAVYRLREPMLRASLRFGGLDAVDPDVRSELANRLEAFLAGAMAISEGPLDVDALTAAALPQLSRALREMLSTRAEAAPFTALEARLVALGEALSCSPDRQGAR